MLNIAPSSGGRPRALFLGADARYMYRFRLPIMQDLAAMGFEVLVATPAHEYFCPPLDVVRHRDWKIRKASLNPFEEVVSIYRLYQILREEKPELVFAHTIKPIIYGLSLAVMVGAKTRCALIPGLGYAFGEERSARRYLTNWAARLGYGMALGRSNVIFLQNEEDKQTLNALNLLPSRAAVHILPGSGLDMTHFPRAALPPASPFTFLLVSRLIKEKGIIEFVEAARIVKRAAPHCRFVVVGARDKVPSAIPQSQLEAWTRDAIVEFRGHVDDPRPDYAACHVFVLPSYYREGCPRANLEAMATGRAVITTDSVGCRDTVVDGVSGVLVPPRDHEALAQAMIKLAQNPALVAQMGEASWALCRSRFELGVVTAQMRHAIMDAMPVMASLER